MNSRSWGLFVAILFIIAVSEGCSNSSPPNPTNSPVACSALEDLRQLNQNLVVMINPRTGNTVEYTVVGDGKDSDEVLVFFPGTGGIIPDWPVQMITNSTISPLIADTAAYEKNEDVSVSLCHSYRMVFFDYAGIGDGQLVGNLTFDGMANDVDAILTDVQNKFGISTQKLNLVGWSLGTLAAMKYSFLAQANQPAREIDDLVLIATRAGGHVSGNVSAANQAACVIDVFKALESPNLDSGFKFRLQFDAFRLTFPYVNQQPYSSADSDCSVVIDTTTGAITYSVELNECLPGGECYDNFVDELFNRETQPWKITGGVPNNVFVDQRDVVSDYTACFCATPQSGFTSGDCSCVGAVAISPTNGGICQCQINDATPQSPSCSNCVNLGMRDQITVINGPEDLFIQHTYGAELVSAYQAQFGASKANLIVYPGSDGAGHGILLQHPGWTQEQIFSALTQNPSVH